MALAIGKLKGMTPDLELKLRARGLKTADDLFNAALAPAGRTELADCAGASDQVILELANRADLSRIKGSD